MGEGIVQEFTFQNQRKKMKNRESKKKQSERERMETKVVKAYGLLLLAVDALQGRKLNPYK